MPAEFTPGGVVRHSLSGVDREAMVAYCSACTAVVSVQRSGNGLTCREANRQAKARWKASHPTRHLADRKRPRSAHRLSDRVGEMATCAVCGPVTAIRKGRGWMCKNRADELGWSADEEIAPRCADCLSWLTREGECPSCDDRMGTDLAYGLLVMEHAYRFATPVAETEFLERDGPLVLTDEDEFAVPGWETLGSDEPWDAEFSVKPEYARLYGKG